MLLSWSAFALLPLLEFWAFHWPYFLSIHSLNTQSQWTFRIHPTHFFLVPLLFLLVCYNFSLFVERRIHCAVFVARGTLWVRVCIRAQTGGQRPVSGAFSDCFWDMVSHWTQCSLTGWNGCPPTSQLQRSACLYSSPRTSVADAHWPHLASLCRCWDLDLGNSL